MSGDETKGSTGIAMTIVLILLALVSAIAVALGMELIRLFGQAPGAAELPQLAAELSGPDKYRPVERLFDEADARFLRSRMANSSELEKRLRRSRRQVMQSYLRVFRRDFEQAWNVGRFLAPFSDDPNFGVTLVAQLLTFYRLYVSLEMRMLLHGYQPGVEVSQLLSALRQVRRIALTTLTSVEQMAIQPSAA
jgi:hypothetical protein